MLACNAIQFMSDALQTHREREGEGGQLEDDGQTQDYHSIWIWNDKKGWRLVRVFYLKAGAINNLETAFVQHTICLTWSKNQPAGMLRDQKPDKSIIVQVFFYITMLLRAECIAD